VHNSTDIPDAAAPGRAVDPSVIGTMRGQIDALDTAIARLVAERAQLSRHIQATRVDAGGTRVELGRERAILSRYRSRLGSEGSALAEAVLRVCRGSQ
jgi:chorismate mutase